MVFHLFYCYFFNALSRIRQIWYRSIVLEIFFMERSFFRSGVTTACLRDLGIMLCLRLLFTVGLMTGRRDVRNCFRMFVGWGSRQHDFEFPSKISFEICSSDIFMEWIQSSSTFFSSRCIWWGMAWWHFITNFCNLKNPQNLISQFFFFEEWVGSEVFFFLCGRELKILNSSFDHFLHHRFGAVLFF